EVPESAVGLGGRLYYTHDDGIHGNELWVLDPHAGSISGSIFNDSNSNGLKDPTEKGLTGWRVYVDLNNDGVCNRKVPPAHTNSAGRYVIADLLSGNYRIRQKPRGGWRITTRSAYSFALSPGGSSTKRFGHVLI